MIFLEERSHHRSAGKASNARSKDHSLVIAVLLIPCNAGSFQRRWKWIGHTLRKSSTNFTRQALTWNPQGKRKRGRPRNSRRLDLEADMRRLKWLHVGELQQLAQDHDDSRVPQMGLQAMIDWMLVKGRIRWNRIKKRNLPRTEASTDCKEHDYAFVQHYKRLKRIYHFEYRRFNKRYLETMLKWTIVFKDKSTLTQHWVVRFFSLIL